MTKRILSFCAFALFMITQVHAQTVTVDDVYVVPGKTGEFTVCLSGGKTDKYTAMTLKAQFPKTGFTTVETTEPIADSKSFEILSPSWQGDALGWVGAVDETGLAIIPFASSEAIAIGESKQQLVTVRFNVANNVTAGTYNVTLKGTEFEYNTSDKDVAGDVKFKVTVVDLGDVNGDGDVDIADAVCIVNHVVGKNNVIFIKPAADVNNDVDMDIADAVRIVNLVVGKINTLSRQLDYISPDPE